MSKTPEEMAEEYLDKNYELDPHFPADVQGDKLPDRQAARPAFLAGYKAGCENTQTQLAVGEKTIRELLGKPQWISVKDRLPEMNELCIVNTEWRGVVPATYGNESWIFDDGQGWSEKALSYAAHWMPLPAPPKEEE